MMLVFHFIIQQENFIKNLAAEEFPLRFLNYTPVLTVTQKL